MLDVHDLPQLYKKPPLESLIQTLELLQLAPTSFSPSTTSDSILSTNTNPHKEVTSQYQHKHKHQEDDDDNATKVDPKGVPRYLTSIIASPLKWLANDTDRETIWDLASARLSERSGRTAMASMTRAFTINGTLTISLYEPSLTGDNLGFKTWTSSLLLARRLELLRSLGHFPSLDDSNSQILELGSGTGLVGIAAAVVLGVSVVLTDLPDIVPNLRANVEANSHLVAPTSTSPDSTDSTSTSSTVTEIETGTKEQVDLKVEALDWADCTRRAECETDTFEVIIAADPIYSGDHPRLLVDTVMRWIRASSVRSRFILELPLRKGYERERDDLRRRLDLASMDLVQEGTEIGYDDWQGRDGLPSEVECWWSVWKPRQIPQQK